MEGKEGYLSREAPKPTPKKKRSEIKTEPATKDRSSSANFKKSVTTVAKKIIEKLPFKLNKTTDDSLQRTYTLPKVSTPKPKEKKSEPPPGSLTNSVRRQSWKRRPKPAHSGVPLPEKMKQLLQEEGDDYHFLSDLAEYQIIVESLQRSNSLPKVSTPKPKENKSEPPPGSSTNSVRRQSWKRRPKPAHSGVPVPEKMKQMNLTKQFDDFDDFDD